MWVADKRVELKGISLDSGDTDLTIHLYEQIPETSGSDLVYRLCCDNPSQVQSHTELVQGNISMTEIYVTVERHTFARNKIPPPLELLYGKDLQWKLNCGKEFYDKIAKEAVF